MGGRESTTQEQTSSWLYKACLRRTWVLINSEIVDVEAAKTTWTVSRLHRRQ